MSDTKSVFNEILIKQYSNGIEPWSAHDSTSEEGVKALALTCALELIKNASPTASDLKSNLYSLEGYVVQIESLLKTS